MRILDESGQELHEPDMAKGRLVPERIVVAHHDAVEAVPKVTEDVLVWSDPDDPGNALYAKRTVAPAIPAKPAWDETEDILRYVPYTDAELAEIAEREAEEEAARKEAEAAAAVEAEKRATIEALPGKVNDLEEAAAELGIVADEAATMGAVNAADIVDTQEAIAEIGVMVAELFDSKEA